MHILLQLFGSIFATTLIYGLYVLVDIIMFRLNSSIKDLPGPPSPSLIWGNMNEIRENPDSVMHEAWVEEWGRTIRYKWMFGIERLFTMDTKALNHILMNPYIYQKPEVARYGLGRLLGAGVLVTEEDKHKLQRKIMNPAFGPLQIRELTETFIEKSVELRDVLATQIAAAGGIARIDILSPLSKATLDIIGRAGFNYKFDALRGESSDLNKAFSVIFGEPQGLKFWPIAQTLIPALRSLPSQDPAGFKQAQRTMASIGQDLLRESKKSLKESGEKGGNWNSRDLLSLLVKSNMSGDPSQRMSDEDVLAQVPTFIVAGHETTSTATTWALFALVKHLDMQHKLREELYTITTENPTMDELNSLPYLDKVVRETLRVYSPVTATTREAIRDDVIPLGKSFVDNKGVVRDSITIRKGQTIYIPILALNRDKLIWGEDSKEFKPERWDNIPEAATSIPGIWGNLMTFLGGARACIGYRFSLVEMKALLFVLVRGFEFELAVPREDVISKTIVVQRPRLKSEQNAGSQLPLLVKVHHGH